MQFPKTGQTPEAILSQLDARKTDDVPWAEKQMWAPDAAFKNDTYYFYFPAKDIYYFVGQLPYIKCSSIDILMMQISHQCTFLSY